MRGILAIENMNFIKKRITIYMQHCMFMKNVKSCDVTDSIIDTALSKIGHYMAIN